MPMNQPAASILNRATCITASVLGAVIYTSLLTSLVTLHLAFLAAFVRDIESSRQKNTMYHASQK